MRQIKFKGVNAHGDYVYGLPAYLGSGFTELSHYILCESADGALTPIPVKSGSLRQFTGIKDSKGVEIYEGDIIEDHYGQGNVDYVDKYAAFRVNYMNGYAKWFYDYSLKGERDSIRVICD